MRPSPLSCSRTFHHSIRKTHIHETAIPGPLHPSAPGNHWSPFCLYGFMLQPSRLRRPPYFWICFLGCGPSLPLTWKRHETECCLHCFCLGIWCVAAGGWGVGWVAAKTLACVVCQGGLVEGTDINISFWVKGYVLCSVITTLDLENLGESIKITICCVLGYIITADIQSIICK